MPVNSIELREKRSNAVKKARAIYERAEGEKREPTVEERGEFDKLMELSDELKAEIVRLESLQAAESDMAGTDGEGDAPPPDGQNSGRSHRSGGLTRLGRDGASLGDDGREKRTGRRASKEYREAFGAYLHGGLQGLGPKELRALQADVDISGGYMIAPEQFTEQLIQAVDDAVVIRELATIIPITKAESLGAPTLDTDPSDAEWTTELGTGQDDSAMGFGKRELTPKPLAKRIKVSKKLLRISALPAEQLVMQRLAYKFGITQEKAFMTGSGANQPLGLFTASADGVPTSRDYSTDATSTSITADQLIGAKYALKAQYQASAATRWLFHRDAIKQIRKLKDGENRYLWIPGLEGGSEDTILGVGVKQSEYVPNTFTTGLYVGMIADFSHYWIVEALQMEVQRLIELYAGSNQIGIIGRVELDAAPVLPEAFVRLKLA